ncbi:uncharacterized protein LOC135939003 [Cloeon dipterum]|uniref:Uncharacterized protein n=1 Tax=Cloeon dipterum TaxID=197152 RepID=A0A8S1DB99_9INSE|nr:Hypothetical predicted protein [Cloeon dipterum]
MASKIVSVALFACLVLASEAKPQLFATPAVVATPVATVRSSAALSAHPVPGTNLISGYSSQAVHQISRSTLLTVPAASYVAAPYVTARYLSSPYVSARYVSAPLVSAPTYYV